MCNQRAYLPGSFQLFSERLSRAFNVDPDARGAVPGEVLSGVQPAAIMSLDDHQFLWLSRISSFAGKVTTPAAAGAASVMRLINPASSKIVATVRRITILNSQGTVQDYSWGVYTVGDVLPAYLNTAAASVGVRDSRMVNNLGASQGGRCTCQANTTLGAITTGRRVRLPANDSREYLVELTIAPGGELAIFAETVNTAFIGSLDWEERIVEPTELS